MAKTKEIASRIKFFRISNSWRQGNFAENLGIPQSQISQIEDGHKSLTFPQIEILVVKHHLNADWLFTGEGSPDSRTITLSYNLSKKISNLEALIKSKKNGILHFCLSDNLSYSSMGKVL